MIERAVRKMALAGILSLIAAPPAITSFAQVSTPPPAPPPVAPVAAAPPVFEVSTVRENKSGSTNSGSSFDHGRFTASNILLKNLMQYEAYGIPEARILGGPKWLNTERSTLKQRQIAR
jgi:hypothetical protein